MVGRLLSLTAALIVAMATAAPAFASCAEPPPIEAHLAQAEAIFVGTVQQVSNEARTASVDVHEIWSGPDLPSVVIVHGGPEDPTEMTSADRYFEAGSRYLFAVSARDGRLEDNACTATRPWSEEIAVLRPDEVREPAPPTPAGTDGIQLPAPVLVAILGATAIVLTGFLAFRRRA